MGVVWRGVDMLIERTVALKELRAPAGVTEGDGDAGWCILIFSAL